MGETAEKRKGFDGVEALRMAWKREALP